MLFYFIFRHKFRQIKYEKHKMLFFISFCWYNYSRMQGRLLRAVFLFRAAFQPNDLKNFCVSALDNLEHPPKYMFWKFCQKLKILSKIENFVKNGKFWQKRKILSKIENFTKNLNFVKNWIYLFVVGQREQFGTNVRFICFIFRFWIICNNAGEAQNTLIVF